MNVRDRHPNYHPSSKLKWCWDTTTFIFHWCEATITLEDVLIYGNCFIFGAHGLSSLRSRHMAEVRGKLKKKHNEAARGSSLVAMSKIWMDGNQIYIWPCFHYGYPTLLLRTLLYLNIYVGKCVFPIITHVSRGYPVVLSSAVLSNIYRDLSPFKDWLCGSNVMKITKLVNFCKPVQLVQVWDCEGICIFWQMIDSILQGASTYSSKPAWAEYECWWYEVG